MMNDEIIFQQAQALFKKNKHRSALRKIARAIRISPRNIDYLLFRSKIKRDLCEHQNALEDIENHLRYEPTLQLMMEKAIILAEKRDFQLAISIFDEVINLDAHSFIAFSNRAEVFRIKKEYKLAIKDFNSALRLRDDDTYAMVGRGEVYLAIGDYPKAYDDFIGALKLSPEDAWCHYQLALCYFLLGKLEFFENHLAVAISLLMKHKNVKKPNPRNLMNLALFNLASKNYSTAISIYSKFIQRNTCNLLFYESSDDIDFLVEKIYPGNMVFIDYARGIIENLHLVQS